MESIDVSPVCRSLRRIRRVPLLGRLVAARLIGGRLPAGAPKVDALTAAVNVIDQAAVFWVSLPVIVRALNLVYCAAALITAGLLSRTSLS